MPLPLQHMTANLNKRMGSKHFIADLHIHSRFSMATSRELTLPHLAQWAARKGIHVLGTGDFTHPQWLAELGSELERDETSGLYRLSAPLPGATNGPLFCLQTEISCVYKRHGKTRRVHNLVFMPNLDAARRFAQRLEKAGNISSDGRPILHVDSRDLLEMALESCQQAVLVPAHVWTPWYSLFGARSGFDSLEECFGDLSSHIFALETGLSSDPPMNRLWSQLDYLALVSNSDAHSGANLGREANMFQGAPSYDGIFESLRKAARREDTAADSCRFLGTCEFYPEEGKYHLDGHRACNIALDPEESRALGNKCPVCGKPLTMGVLHRVEDLADRRECVPLPNEPEAKMLVPLPEVVAQIYQCGANTRKVEQQCLKIVSTLGPELDVLCQLPVEEIRAFWEPLGEAVERIRAGRLRLCPGFDGRYGKTSIFEAGELQTGKR